MPSQSSATQIEYERPFTSGAMILFALADGALVVDTDGIVRQANLIAAALLGIPSDALAGSRLADLPFGEMLGAIAAERAGEIAIDDRTVGYSSAPLRSEDGRDTVVGALILLRDRTDERARKQTQYDF